MKRIFTHIGFSTAVTLLVINLLPVKSISLIMLGLAVLSAASLVIFKGKEKAVFVCLISGVFACGVFLCTYNATVAPQLSLDSAEADTEFYITDIAKIDDDGNYVYTVKTTKINCDGAPQNIKLHVKSTRKINADYYETVKGKLKFYSIADNASSSYGYWGEKIFLSAKGSKFTATGNKINSPWKYTLLLREDIINTLYAQIGGDEGALSAAFLTGENSLLSDKAYTDFVFAGATHLMAVSGLHLTVITAAFAWILKRIKVKDKASALILAICVLVYIGVAGFSKSVIRAGIMLLVMLGDRIIKRRPDALNSLGFAVFLICLNPFAVYDLSAMLSVLAVLSLITMYPYLIKLIDKDATSECDGLVVTVVATPFAKIISSALVGASVIVYSLPVCYAFFGYASLSGILCNIVLVPLGSLSVILSLAGYFSIKMNIFSGAAVFIIRGLNFVILKITAWFASFDTAMLNFGEYFGLIIAAILIIFAIPFILGRKGLIKTAAVINTALLIVCGCVNTFYNQKLPKMYIGSGAIVLRCEDTTVLFGVDSKSAYSAANGFLNMSHGDIDILIDSDSCKYAKKIADAYGCNTYITPSFDASLLEDGQIKDITVCSEYKNTLASGVNIKYNLDEGNSAEFEIQINGIKIYSGRNDRDCDIKITDGKITDANGEINSDTRVIYTFYGENYKARGIGTWQK